MHANGESVNPGKWRVGRKLGRTIYRQLGDEPSDRDQLIGMMDTEHVAAMAVEAVNNREAEPCDCDVVAGDNPKCPMHVRTGGDLEAVRLAIKMAIKMLRDQARFSSNAQEAFGFPLAADFLERRLDTKET